MIYIIRWFLGKGGAALENLLSIINLKQGDGRNKYSYGVMHESSLMYDMLYHMYQSVLKSFVRYFNFKKT